MLAWTIHKMLQKKQKKKNDKTVLTLCDVVRQWDCLLKLADITPNLTRLLKYDLVQTRRLIDWACRAAEIF